MQASLLEKIWPWFKIFKLDDIVIRFDLTTEYRVTHFQVLNNKTC